MEGQEKEPKPTERLVGTAREMIEAYRDLVSLSIVENVSLGVSVSIVGVVSLVVTCFVLLFGALGAAWWIGESMNNMKAGFFIAGSAFLLFLIIILLSAKKGLIPMIRNMVIKKIYEEDN